VLAVRNAHLATFMYLVWLTVFCRSEAFLGTPLLSTWHRDLERQPLVTGTLSVNLARFFVHGRPQAVNLAAFSLHAWNTWLALASFFHVWGP